MFSKNYITYVFFYFYAIVVQGMKEGANLSKIAYSLLKNLKNS